MDQHFFISQLVEVFFVFTCRKQLAINGILLRLTRMRSRGTSLHFENT
jgi:hypothetical protein